MVLGPLAGRPSGGGRGHGCSASRDVATHAAAVRYVIRADASSRRRSDEAGDDFAPGPCSGPGGGLVLGFIGAWFTAQLLAGVLPGIEPHDPPTFALVPLLLALVAAVACYLPSRRATRIDPNLALRSD